MRGIKSRLIAATITLLFFMFVQPDPDPSIAGIAISALLMYEALRFCIEFCTQTQKKREHRKVVLMNKKAMKETGEILDDMLFNPIREVI